MKKLILLAGVAALAACGGGADEAPADDTLTVDDTAMTADNDMTTDYVGTHAIYDADGNSLGTTVTNSDGTYTQTAADGSEVSGTWMMNDNGQLCFDEDGEAVGESCWTPGDTVDGRVRMTNAAGESVMIDFTPA
ncbi:hypothetical protein [Sphingomicrobium clamense]|uniref:Lipoprotein n=1 Tax=Sphingomicrobium clamense TaxID=2851013 RepID=A0ABS6V530_9SPHN|nr:hypothetical protein [Sphingomicrobium sp. B8]MBW0144664.1 hypothetical protein [Sphingomicrobium sp. B8]